MPDGVDPVERFRAICLALPGSAEIETWGDPTFRVGRKIYAMVKRGDGRLSAWVKTKRLVQAMLTQADPVRFFVPPYVGHHGWVGVRLDGEVDWDELADLISDAHAGLSRRRARKSVDR